METKTEESTLNCTRSSLPVPRKVKFLKSINLNSVGKAKLALSSPENNRKASVFIEDITIADEDILNRPKTPAFRNPLFLVVVPSKEDLLSVDSAKTTGRSMGAIREKLENKILLNRAKPCPGDLEEVPSISKTEVSEIEWALSPISGCQDQPTYFITPKSRKNGEHQQRNFEINSDQKDRLKAEVLNFEALTNYHSKLSIHETTSKKAFNKKDDYYFKPQTYRIKPNLLQLRKKPTVESCELLLNMLKNPQG